MQNGYNIIKIKTKSFLERAFKPKSLIDGVSVICQVSSTTPSLREVELNLKFISLAGKLVWNQEDIMESKEVWVAIVREENIIYL